ncbi:MAG TPA: outer membrane lipoprotein carrier protein LolA [Saprospiraceae bacterium]|nr:outer membrane lipoprotein carrier protein LolA [Saprospiraceae bacterium]
MSLIRISLLFLLALRMYASPASAQTNQYLTREDSDPQALSLINKLEAQLNQDRLSLEFEMSISHPADEAIQQKGRFIQQGDMYRIIAEDVEIWCNGKLRWTYSKDANEVNLYAATDGDALGPISLLAEYTGDQYVAILSGSDQIRSLPVQVIELKPVDRNSEIAKIRVSVQNDGKPVRIEIMEKTATRTVTDFYKIGIPETHPESYFTFNKADYPGVHVEDLRID